MWHQSKDKSLHVGLTWSSRATHTIKVVKRPNDGSEFIGQTFGGSFGHENLSKC